MVMRHKNYISFVLFCSSITVLFSCGHKDYSMEVKQIDSLKTQLNEVSLRYQQLDIQRLGAYVDSVNTHLEYVQKNYVGYQREDMAKVLGDYRRIKKLIPDIASAHPKIMEEIKTDLQQLSDLQMALTEHATHDAAGNKITAEYIEKAFLSETKAASDLIKQLDLLMERAPLADSIYHRNYDQVRFWVDSIPSAPPLPVPR
jgi:division protein CdvB (Snf7/Vps24/ESCRT-III family)